MIGNRDYTMENRDMKYVYNIDYFNIINIYIHYSSSNGR